MNTITIAGPLGPFLIPDTCERTRKHCEALTRQVFDGEYHHPDLLKLECKTGGLGLTAVDIGAGWGAFTVWVVAALGAHTVFAYEPHAEAADLWERNSDAAQRTPGGLLRSPIGCCLTRAAVTTDPAPHLNGCEDWGSYHTHNVLGGWPVPAVHPRDLPPCDILKADCEGCEVEVLEHYPHLSKCQALLVEYHGLDKRKRVFELAEAAGFRCVKAPAEDVDYGPTVWVRR